MWVVPSGRAGGAAGSPHCDAVSSNLVAAGLQASDTILSATNPNSAELNGPLDRSRTMYHSEALKLDAHPFQLIEFILFGIF